MRCAREEGREEALRSVRVLLLEAGAFSAAELVRGLDLCRGPGIRLERRLDQPPLKIAGNALR